jgi:hypothetical protein
MPAQKNLMVVTAKRDTLADWIERLAGMRGEIVIEGEHGSFPSAPSASAMADMLMNAVAKETRPGYVRGWIVNARLDGEPGVILEPTWVIPAELAGKAYGSNTTGLTYGGH